MGWTAEAARSPSRIERESHQDGVSVAGVLRRPQVDAKPTGDSLRGQPSPLYRLVIQAYNIRPSSKRAKGAAAALIHEGF